MNILFLVVNNYPNGDAGAIRQHAFAKILQKMGHKITIVSLNKSKHIDLSYYEGVEYKAIKGRYFESKNQLKKYLSECDTPDVMFLNTIPLPAFYYAKQYALKHNVKLVHDCVEWYSIDEYSLLNIRQFVHGYMPNSIVNRFILDKHFKVISISSYLESYFKSKGIPTIRVPVIMDIKNITSIKQEISEILTITYAGSPQRKDYLTNILTAIEMLDKSEREKINFTIMGITEKGLAEITNKPITDIRKIECINVQGRVPHESVLEHLKNSNFTILIRSDKARYAKAGFPTKVVESLAFSTPVILNLTSDLEMYLRDGHDCLTVASEKPEDIVVTLRRALALSTDKKKQMYLNARKTAESSFDITDYCEILEEFLFN